MTTKNRQPEKSKTVELKSAGDVELAEDRPVFTPATDIYEKDEAVLVRCDMPGVDEKSLEVTLEDNVLTLTGSQRVAAPAKHDLVQVEYETGVFRRSFTIHQDIDNQHIKARIKNGVLDLHLPKAEQARPRKIAVEAG